MAESYKNRKMNKVTVREEELPKEFHLHNGDLVIIYNDSDEVEDTYIVTSFRYNQNGKKYRKPIGDYCSLVNLANGYLAFEEPSSRNTDARRLRNHIVIYEPVTIKVMKVGKWENDISGEISFSKYVK